VRIDEELMEIWLNEVCDSSILLSKNPPNLSLDGNLSPNRLGHSLMLGVNSWLHVISVGFQLYSQLKKSLHNGTGVSKWPE